MHTHAHTHARTHTRTHAHAHTRARARTHTRTRTHAHAHTRTHTHTHIHTHTHTHARTHTGYPSSSAGKELLQCRKPQFNSWSRRSAEEGIGHPPQYSWTSLVVQLAKNLPAMRETPIRSLGWEDPPEKGRLPTPVFWLGLRSPWGLKESDTERLSLS